MIYLGILIIALCLWPGSLPAADNAATTPAPPETILKTYYSLPDQISFCGEEVPLQDPEVREDLDREFNIVLWNRTQTTMWLKRAARYFPYLEKRLQEAKLPDDLKYVVLVESDLRLNARSPAGACGPWQSGDRLSNSGEELILRNNAERIMDQIPYSDSSDWPVTIPND